MKGIFCLAILAAVFLAGCTSTPSQPAPATTVITTVPPTMVATPAATPAAPGTTVATQAPVPVTTAVTTAPASVISGTPSGLTISYTAASLKGASTQLGPAFGKAYPGTQVIFDLDGTQILKHQVEAGAYTDVFISASNAYTRTLTDEGYFIDGTVKPLTSNYIIVILPAKNPGNIQSLADLGVPGKRLAMGTADVPVGINTRIVIDRLANSTYGTAWKDQVYRNVKTYETTEPGIVTKVSLGEVDAGFVYESSYKVAKPGTLLAINIPEKDNALQTYTVGVMKICTNKPTALAFENFLLSPDGQKILSDFGFRPVS